MKSRFMSSGFLDLPDPPTTLPLRLERQDDRAVLTGYHRAEGTYTCSKSLNILRFFMCRCLVAALLIGGILFVGRGVVNGLFFNTPTYLEVGDDLRILLSKPALLGFGLFFLVFWAGFFGLMFQAVRLDYALHQRGGSGEVAPICCSSPNIAIA